MPLAIDYRPTTLKEVVGNEGIKKSLTALLKRPTKDIPRCFAFFGNSGCVDNSTEFMTPMGWKKISEYKNGDLVLQFDKFNETANFVKPIRYIKQKTQGFKEVHTKYGLDMCLSEQHRMLVVSKKTGEYSDIVFKNFVKKHEQNVNGSSYLIPTSFTLANNSELSYSIAQLRVQVMVNADGSISEDRKKCSVNLKKQTKIERARKLLIEANIEFDEYKMANGYTRFYFVPPTRNKRYSKLYYRASFKQMVAIADEVLYWDASISGGKKVYFSCYEEDANFIQFVFHAIGKRASIIPDIRQNKPICYRVCITDRVNVGVGKQQFSQYSEHDGYEYCFTVPSSYLILRRNGRIFITGNCGKTTIARIVASMLGCESTDFYELNAASVRGIDTIRDIEKQIRFKPIHGKKRVWLLDECFTKGTKIQTPSGSINIEDIKSGDIVFSAFGTDVVKATFQNRVELERLVKVSLSDGTVFFCSNQHEFYTNEGWIFAENLNSKHLLFPFNLTIIENINSQRKEKTHNEIKSNCKMSKLREKVSEIWKEQKSKSLLQQKMCGVVEICGNENRSGLSNLQKNIYTIENQQATEEILQSDLFKQGAKNTLCSYRRNKKKNIIVSSCISQNKTFHNCEKKTVRKNETKQSSKKPNGDRKVKNHQKNERYFKRVVGGTRRQWEIYTASDIVGNSFGLGNGSCGFVRKETTGLSDKLQIGCRQSRIENRYRNKRTFTSHEEDYAKRCQEESKTRIVRVDRVEFYKQTSNRGAFDGVVGDIETSQGFITLYDFEVKNHPSYFANGILVHNCHQYPSATQEALLKMFEECPEHVAFMICTTDPQKLKPALKGRCTTFEVKPLDDEEMGDFLYGICEAEEVDVPEEVIEKIVSVSNGSPRNALQQLEKIIDLPEKEMLKSIQQIQEMESQVKDLITLLLKKSVKWGEVCKVLSTIEAEPEQIRYAVLGYCSAILLKGDNPRAFLIMSEFTEPTYNTGKPGIVMAAYSVVTGG